MNCPAGDLIKERKKQIKQLTKYSLRVQPTTHLRTIRLFLYAWNFRNGTISGFISLLACNYHQAFIQKEGKERKLFDRKKRTFCSYHKDKFVRTFFLHKWNQTLLDSLFHSFKKCSEVMWRTNIWEPVSNASIFFVLLAPK